MGDSINVDFSELLELAADLTDSPSEVNRNVKKAIEVTARNVKDDARQSAEHNRTHGYARSIDYDVTAGKGEIAAEIGPNLSRYGGKTGKGGTAPSLGILEESQGDVLGTPQHALRDALKANEPDFFRGLEIAVADAQIDKG